MSADRRIWFTAAGAAVAGGLVVALWPRKAQAAQAATTPCPDCAPCPPPRDPPVAFEPADVAIYSFSKYTPTYDPALAWFVRTVQASSSQAAVIDTWNKIQPYNASDGASVMAIDPVTARPLWTRGWDGKNMVITGDPARVAALSSRLVQPYADALGPSHPVGP